jgi:hypothetical protein
MKTVTLLPSFFGVRIRPVINSTPMGAWSEAGTTFSGRTNPTCTVADTSLEEVSPSLWLKPVVNVKGIRKLKKVNLY